MVAKGKKEVVRVTDTGVQYLEETDDLKLVENVQEEQIPSPVQ